MATSDPFQPRGLDRDDTPTRSPAQKGTAIPGSGTLRGTERHSRTIPRQEVVGKALLIDRPDDLTLHARITRRRQSRLEDCDIAVLADVIQLLRFKHLDTPGENARPGDHNYHARMT